MHVCLLLSALYYHLHYIRHHRHHYSLILLLAVGQSRQNLLRLKLAWLLELFA